MRISDWSSDVCSSDLERDIELAHVRRQDGDAERRSVRIDQQSSQHRLEVMDVAVDLVAELGFGLVMLGDLADLGRIQQPHRAPREHAAVALEIGLPRSEEHTSELQSLMRNSYA